MDFIIDWASTISKQGIQNSQAPRLRTRIHFRCGCDLGFVFSFFLIPSPQICGNLRMGGDNCYKIDMEKL